MGVWMMLLRDAITCRRPCGWPRAPPALAAGGANVLARFRVDDALLAGRRRCAVLHPELLHPLPRLRRHLVATRLPLHPARFISSPCHPARHAQGLLVRTRASVLAARQLGPQVWLRKRRRLEQ